MIDIKNIYPVRPFKMGSKKGKTIGMVIPAPIVRFQAIDTSTIFLVRLEGESRIILEKINEKKVMPVEKSIAASTQQASTSMNH